jgi:hypothetical protein
MGFFPVFTYICETITSAITPEILTSAVVDFKGSASVVLPALVTKK